jgi:putative transposase
LNNIIEQDHRFIKKITKPMMEFKAFYSAQATIAGIETAHMIRKGQLSEENIPASLQIGEFPCRLLRTKNHHFAIAPFP